MRSQNLYANFQLCSILHPKPPHCSGVTYICLFSILTKARKRYLVIYSLKFPNQWMAKDSLGFCHKHASELALSMRNVLIFYFSLSLKKVRTFSVLEFSFFISLKFWEYLLASIFRKVSFFLRDFITYQ